MTPSQVYEAQELIRAHQGLRHCLNHDAGRCYSLHAQDSERGLDALFPKSMSVDLLVVLKALVESRLRALGVEPSPDWDECFECGGTGKR